MDTKVLVSAAATLLLAASPVAHADHNDRPQPTVHLGFDVLWGGDYGYGRRVEPVPRVYWYPVPAYQYGYVRDPYTYYYDRAPGRGWARGHHRYHHRHDRDDDRDD